MKVILAMVMSLDGKTTKWSNPKITEWTSEEDQKYFSSLVKKNKVIIMGRKTFVAAKSIIKLSPGKLRVVMTKTPEKYAHFLVPGQLEFTSESPKQLLKKLKAQGHKQVLLTGGEYINTLFFRAKLINEVWLTVEPSLFGLGNNLTAQEKLDVNLQLKSIKKLNKKGTILLKYQVV